MKARLSELTDSAKRKSHAERRSRGMGGVLDGRLDKAAVAGTGVSAGVAGPVTARTEAMMGALYLRAHA